MAKPSGASLSVVTPSSHKRIPVPDHLTGRQRTIWSDIVDSLPADYFRAGDVPLLACYCQAYDFYRMAATEIELNGPTITDERGKSHANPAGQLLSTQAAALANMAVKLRLCPSARYTEKSAATKASRGGGRRPWDEE